MNFDDLRGGEKPDIHDVLSDLEDKKIISDWAYHGDHPTCEKNLMIDFQKSFQMKRDGVNTLKIHQNLAYHIKKSCLIMMI